MPSSTIAGYTKILWGKSSSLASVNVLKVSEILSFLKSLLPSFPFQMVLEQVYYFHVFKNLVIGNEWTWFIYSLVPSLCVSPSVSPWRRCGLEMRLVHLLQMKHIWEFLEVWPRPFSSGAWGRGYFTTKGLIDLQNKTLLLLSTFYF